MPEHQCELCGQCFDTVDYEDDTIAMANVCPKCNTMKSNKKEVKDEDEN